MKALAFVFYYDRAGKKQVFSLEVRLKSETALVKYPNFATPVPFRRQTFNFNTRKSQIIVISLIFLIVRAMHVASNDFVRLPGNGLGRQLTSMRNIAKNL